MTKIEYVGMFDATKEALWLYPRFDKPILIRLQLLTTIVKVLLICQEIRFNATPQAYKCEV